MHGAGMQSNAIGSDRKRQSALAGGVGGGVGCRKRGAFAVWLAVAFLVGGGDGLATRQSEIPETLHTTHQRRRG